MNIAWIVSGLPGTGGGRHIKEVSDRLVSNHWHRVTIYSYDGESQVGPLLSPTKPLKAALSDGPFDVALCYDPGRDAVPAQVFEWTKARLKVWGMFFANAAFDKYIRNPEYLKIAHTSWLAKYARALDPQNVELCVGGVDTEFWDYRSQANRSRAILIYPKKSGWSGLAAVQEACRQDPTLEMWRFSGQETSLDPDLYMWGKDVGAPANQPEKVREAYQTAMMYVNSESNWGWGFSQCLAEAMSCGCPIVGGDWEGFSDMLTPQTAVLVPNNEAPEFPQSDWLTRPSPRKLANEIVALANDPSRRCGYALRASRQIKQFDYTPMVKKMNNIFERRLQK